MGQLVPTLPAQMPVLVEGARHYPEHTFHADQPGAKSRNRRSSGRAMEDSAALLAVDVNHGFQPRLACAATDHNDCRC